MIVRQYFSSHNMYRYIIIAVDDNFHWILIITINVWAVVQFVVDTVREIEENGYDRFEYFYYCFSLLTIDNSIGACAEENTF